jgi:hypothetical protein
MVRAHNLTLAILAVALGCALPAQAQEAPAAPASAPAARALPKPEELEPAVDTTHSAPASAPAATNTAPGPTDAAAGPAAAAAGKTVVPRPASAPTAAKSGSRKGPDTLQLDATEITGNRELPKVLYIVPWKRSDLGDLAGKPVNSLLDEVLQPLDRDVFRRENRYYDALQPGRASPKTDPVQGSGDKP